MSKSVHNDTLDASPQLVRQTKMFEASSVSLREGQNSEY